MDKNAIKKYAIWARNELIAKVSQKAAAYGIEKDNIVDAPLGMKAYKVFSARTKARIFFEKIETEADKLLKDAEIARLKSSIERREKLLGNENYVNKAPKNIVELDRSKLEEEKKKLEELLK